MGDKKQKEAAQKKWKKVLFVILAVLFVVVMVVSSMGSNWISGLAPVRAGDQVVIDYTIYDTVGNPLLTSNQQLYTQLAQSGKGILYTKQLTLTANHSLTQGIFPVPVYSSKSGNWTNFGLFSPEYDALTYGIVGMRVNEKKSVVFTTNTSLSRLFSPSEIPYNLSSYQIGDTVAIGLSQNGTAANSSNAPFRIGEVSRISSAGIVVNFGYPNADVSIVSDTKQ